MTRPRAGGARRACRAVCGAVAASLWVVTAVTLLPRAAGAQAASGGSAQDATRADTASAMALYRRAAARFAKAGTMRANFEQTLVSPYSSTPRVSRGTLLQRPPARFAFRFSDPAGDVVIADGDALWVYLPSSAKGQVLKLPREVGGAFDVIARLLANPGDRNQVQVAPEWDMVGGERLRLFALTPRAAGAPFTAAKVWIGADALVRQLEIEEPSGVRRRLRFSDMRLGVALPKRAFAFEVPPGVRVIDQAALLGGGTRKP